MKATNPRVIGCQPTCTVTVTTGSSIVESVATRSGARVAAGNDATLTADGMTRNSPASTSAVTHSGPTLWPASICSGTLKSSRCPSTVALFMRPKPLAMACAATSASSAPRTVANVRLGMRRRCSQGSGRGHSSMQLQLPSAGFGACRPAISAK
jgi:hypothetical protein